MKSICEKLGITGGNWYPYIKYNTIAIFKEKVSTNPTEVISWTGFDSSDVPIEEREKNARLIAESKEMLEALIDICRQIEDMGYIAHNIDEYHPITVIESATGKTWDEVKELVGEK